MEAIQRKWDNLGYFNMARGLGMLIVVAGHTMVLFMPASDNAPVLFGGAGSVFGGGLMAMFFLISGFGFYKRKPKKCLSIQAKLLLWPYCIVAAAILLTKLGLSIVERRSFWEHGGELILTHLLGFNVMGGGTVWGVPVDSISILWFLLALFGGWVIYNGISQLKSEKIRWLLVAACTVAGYLLTLVSRVWPFCLPMALLAVGYLAVGAEIRSRHLLERKLPVWCYALLCIPILISAAYGEVDILGCVWKLGLLDVLSTFCLGFLLLRLYAWVTERKLSGRLVLLLEAVGFNSIWVVCLHAYEKVVFPWYRLGEVFPNSPVWCTVLCFCGRCAVMYLLYRIISYANQTWGRGRRKPKIKIELE